MINLKKKKKQRERNIMHSYGKPNLPQQQPLLNPCGKGEGIEEEKERMGWKNDEAEWILQDRERMEWQCVKDDLRFVISFFFFFFLTWGPKKYNNINEKS